MPEADWRLRRLSTTSSGSLGINLGQSWSDTTRVLGFSFFDGEYIITDFVRGAISLTLCVSGFALAAVVLIVGCDLTTKCRLRHGG